MSMFLLKLLDIFSMPSVSSSVFCH